MKYLFVIVFAVLVSSCRQENDQNPVPPQIGVLSAGQPIFTQVKDQLDYSTLEKATGRENVVVWMVRFKGDANKVYATSTKGELLYERQMKDDSNGTIDITKKGETVRITFVNGIRTIGDNSKNLRTADEYHGGPGFCQRENNEKFSDCYKAECDEFCGSFISCVALATQPAVSILIATACSCNAS